MTNTQINDFPDSFASAFGDKYLGNPEIVKALTAQYLVDFEALVRSRSADEISGDEFLGKVSTLVRHHADIFSGRDPAYTIMKGYNDQTLKYKLMADLGEFWRKNRHRWDDDSVCVLFEWAGVMYINDLKTADDDEVLLGIMFRPTQEYFVKVLLGIESRVGQ